jgi:MFS transporter, DHA2 family, multidrug resistance protein
MKRDSTGLHPRADADTDHSFESGAVPPADEAATVGRQPVDRRAWIAIVAGMLGGFMAILDIQIINSSLNQILGALSATREEASWISTAYLVAEIIAIPMTPLMSRAFGLRSYMVGTTALFLVGSTMCAWAWSLESMIFFRVLQGLAGGALIPLAMMLVMVRAPSKRSIGLALFALLTTLAPALGPTLGGYLTELYGWSSIFYINWLPGTLLIAGILYGLDHRPPNLGVLGKADWVAIGCMAIGLGCMTIALEEGNSHEWFDSEFIIVMAGLAVAGLLGWVARYAVGGEPFVDLGLYRRRSFLVASILSAISGMALYGSSFLLPLYLGQIPSYTPMQIGEVMMWVGLPQILVMPLAVVLAHRMDNRLVCSIGMALFGISCLMNVGMDATTGRDELIFSQIVRALGQPLITLTLSNFAVQGLAPKERASASSLYNMVRCLGGSIGIGLLSTALTYREQFHSAHIGEAVTAFSAAVQARIDILSQSFLAHGINAVRANGMALQVIDRLVRRESTVMAYNDCFYLIGLTLLFGIGLLWCMDKVKARKS